MNTIKEFKAAFDREVRHWPSARIEYRNGKRHPRVVIIFRGVSRSRPFPTSAGDWRSMSNAISALRRELREIGAVRQKHLNDN